MQYAGTDELNYPVFFQAKIAVDLLDLILKNGVRAEVIGQLCITSAYCGILS